MASNGQALKIVEGKLMYGDIAVQIQSPNHIVFQTKMTRVKRVRGATTGNFTSIRMHSPLGIEVHIAPEGTCTVSALAPAGYVVWGIEQDLANIALPQAKTKGLPESPHVRTSGFSCSADVSALDILKRMRGASSILKKFPLGQLCEAVTACFHDHKYATTILGKPTVTEPKPQGRATKPSGTPAAFQPRPTL